MEKIGHFCFGLTVLCLKIVAKDMAAHFLDEIFDSRKLIDDGAMPAKVSLAKALLDDPSCLKERKVFIGVPEYHNQPMEDISLLIVEIEKALAGS